MRKIHRQYGYPEIRRDKNTGPEIARQRSNAETERLLPTFGGTVPSGRKRQECDVPLGQRYIFYDRISWALSYLYLAQLVDKPQRGFTASTRRAEDAVRAYAGRDQRLRRTDGTGPHPAQVPQSRNTTEALALSDTPSGELTPQEALEQSFDNIRKSVYAEILETIIGKSPRAFERSCTTASGDGVWRRSKRFGASHPGIKRTGASTALSRKIFLGFGRIYIQAKRYGLNYAVQRDEVQKFVGALAVAQSHKGVFITTSYFTSGAIDYVKGLNGAATIVLIDGKQLAEYIYDSDWACNRSRRFTSKSRTTTSGTRWKTTTKKRPHNSAFTAAMRRPSARRSCLYRLNTSPQCLSR